MSGRTVLVGTATVLIAVVFGGVGLADWPTLHKDVQRSGDTDEMVKGPYERKWFRNFAEEMISTRVEAIVAEGKVFAGTLAGRMYALDVVTGETIWRFQANGPIGHSPCYYRGNLYFGADEGFDSGSVYCLNAEDGSKVWEAKVGAGVFTSPMCDGERVYFGDRGGVFHAVKTADGSEVWKVETGYMILQPPSLSHDGETVVFGSENMHVYAVSAKDGEMQWRSDKLGGLSLRDHGPTIWKGKAIVRTNPARSFHTSLGIEASAWKRLHQSLETKPADEVIFNKWGSYAMKYSDRRAAAEREYVRKYVAEHPDEKTFYALDMSDGTEPWVAPVTFSGVGLHNNPPYPVFDRKSGTMYVWCGTGLSKEGRGIPGLGITVMTIDPKTGDTRDIIRNGPVPAQADDVTQSMNLMGDVLLSTHMGGIIGLDLVSMERHDVWWSPDTYGGIFGQAYHRTQKPYSGFYTGAYLAGRKGEICMMANEWHGPGNPVPAISNDRLFWKVGSQMICIGGPSTPKQASGGTDRPDPMYWDEPHVVPGGNLAVYWEGDYDPNMKRPKISPEQLEKFVSVKAAAPKDGDIRGELLQKVEARLETQILELTEQGPWAPMIIELGISGDQAIFADTAQAMQIVSLALPHLKGETRSKAVAWLDGLYEQGVPLSKSRFDSKEGNRREPYDIGATMSGRQPEYERGVDDLYALWAYAYYADRWEKVKTAQEDIRKVYEEFASRPVNRDHAGNKFTEDKKLVGRVNHIGEELNGQIAGTIGYIRIMKQLGNKAAASKAMGRLAEVVIERVHHEQADDCFIRLDEFGHHSARLPRYLKMTPEVGAILQEFAGDKLQSNLSNLRQELPVWYQAWSERLTGGENYCNPPHLARSIYMGWAEGCKPTPEELAKVLDQPWCKADLFYIEKCTALLRGSLYHNSMDRY